MGEPETDHLVLAGWAVLSSWAVGFAAGIASSSLSVLGAAMLAATGIAVLVPDMWRRGRTAMMGAATLIFPWALNAHTASEPFAKPIILATLALLLAGWAALNSGWIRRMRRRK